MDEAREQNFQLPPLHIIVHSHLKEHTDAGRAAICHLPALSDGADLI